MNNEWIKKIGENIFRNIRKEKIILYTDINNIIYCRKCNKKHYLNYCNCNCKI